MKVAVSVPEPVFAAAERVSKRLRISRSQLYSKAIAAYVRDHPDVDVTEALNVVYTGHASALDPAWEQLSLGVLRRERW